MKRLFFLVLFIASTSNANAQSTNTLEFPATGTWNGFQDQYNVLECASYHLTTASVRLTVNDAAGGEKGQRVIELPSLGVVHTVLNEFDIANQYGTFELELLTAGAAGKIACITAVYRFANGGPVGIDYGYALRVDNPLSGVTRGIYNSFNPEGGTSATLNYLTVVNPGETTFEADVDVFATSGEQIRAVRVTVAPKGRVDIELGHNDTDINNGQFYGIYRIRPLDEDARYLSYLARYLTPAPGFTKYAFTINPVAGACDTKPLFLSTMNPATNWVEVGNGGDTAADVTITFFNQIGQEIAAESHTLAGFSQIHVNANQYLGDNAIGFAKFSCSESFPLLVNSLYYGHLGSSANGVFWAYASQLKDIAADPGQRLVAFSNTFLGMRNWWKVAGNNTATATGYLDLLRTDGSRVSQTPYNLTADFIYDFGLHESYPANTVGQGIFEPPEAGGGVFGELLRVFVHESFPIGAIMRVPVGVVQADDLEVDLELVSDAVTAPLAVVNADDDSDRIFIVERGGTVRIHSGGMLLGTPFLDLSAKTNASGEQGLLSLAFHPDFSSNERVFASYTNLEGTLLIVEFAISDGDSNQVDASSERTVISVPQPFSSHNGGQLQFGSDGYLYVSLGDGGGAGDPEGNGQDPSTLLGSIIRIDVDGAQPYEVPSDNPFVGVSGMADEIWAYGFRNPWRFSFDSVSERLFCGDVGQGLLEEINIVEKGKNYGWNTMEGTMCFNPSENCDTTGLELPVFEYTHDDGVAIIGGYVYRGSAMPELQGAYVFTDFTSGKIWALQESSTGTWIRQVLYEGSFFGAGLGVDEDGELYLADFTGKVSKLIPETE